MTASTLSNYEINTIIKLLREDWQATRINVESELMTKVNLDERAREYKGIKDKLELLRPKE